MTLAEQKEKALGFLKSMLTGDPKSIGGFLADNIEFDMMGRLPGITPIRGREAFVTSMSGAKAMFPNGLEMKYSTVIADGPHVAIQAESNGVASNGKKYANRYHFYIRFAGDKIDQVREYNDVNHVREVFMS